MCKLLHVLPNDPLLAEMTDSQIDWVIANAAEDATKMMSPFEKAKQGIRIENAGDAGQIDALLSASKSQEEQLGG